MMKLSELLRVCVVGGSLLLVQGIGQAETLMKVTLLGTGSPRPAPDRMGPSTLVQAGSQTLIFDMGRGNTISLFRAGVRMGGIDAHFITHMHSDHINGLPDLYLTGWIGVPYAKRTKPFLVYGPQGTKAMMEHLYQAFSEDRRLRFEDEHYPLVGLEVDAHEIQEGPVYERDGVKVSAFEVFHGEHLKPAYGYKIEYRGHSVVLSGDTKYSKRVEKEATGADLLVHEVAAVPGADYDRLFKRFPVYRGVLEHHTNPTEAGKLFAVARPKLAVYSHIVTPSNPAQGVPEATADDILKETRLQYDGPVVVGADLMQFEVSDQGVRLLPAVGGESGSKP